MELPEGLKKINDEQAAGIVGGDTKCIASTTGSSILGGLAGAGVAAAFGLGPVGLIALGVMGGALAGSANGGCYED